MTAFISYKNTVLADSPLVYYRLDEASGTTATDSSGSGHNGTYSATGVTYSVTGAIRGDADKAVTFNGTTGDVTVPSPINPTGSATLECWVKIAANPTANCSLFANYS